LILRKSGFETICAMSVKAAITAKLRGLKNAVLSMDLIPYEPPMNLPGLIPIIGIAKLNAANAISEIRPTVKKFTMLMSIMANLSFPD
jgi:hypothetical protein